jgi:phenylacetate-CoA ligase
VIRRIDGREEDYVVLANGERVGRLDHIFKDQIHIREAQIRQERAAQVEIILVKGNGFTARHEASLLREARARLGSETTIALRYADAVPRTAAGKLRLVYSRIAPITGASVA